MKSVVCPIVTPTTLNDYQRPLAIALYNTDDIKVEK